MEVGENQTAASRVWRRDTKSGGTLIQKDREVYQEDEEDGVKMDPPGGGTVALGSNGNLQNWHHSSRIIRVSRSSGGKDRHSKVLTARGLRDRRIRLSVSTAIQFYDLQDRLGYDQPSKAVEWLIKAAAEPISELPSLHNSFLNIPKQSNIEMRFEKEADKKMDFGQHNQPPPHIPLSNSSNSETSKGYDLSLSRSGLRVSRMKARERARERAVKEKEDDRQHKSPSVYRESLNTINSSFTELLTGAVGGRITTCPTGNSSNPAEAYPNLSSSPMDHLGYTLSSSSRSQDPSTGQGFFGQIQRGNFFPQPLPLSAFNISADNHQDLHQNTVVSEHFLQASSQNNLNFAIASGIPAGLNRGPLQSNSPSFLPHFQRFSPADLPAVPFQAHHYFLQGFGDVGCRHPNQKEKERN